MKYSGTLFIVFLLFIQITAQESNHFDLTENDTKYQSNYFDALSHFYSIKSKLLKSVIKSSNSTLETTPSLVIDPNTPPTNITLNPILSQAAEKIRLRPSPVFVDYPLAYKNNYAPSVSKPTHLKGKVNKPTFSSVAVKFYKDLISFEESEFVLPLGQNNQFDFQFDLSEPTIAKLAYGNQDMFWISIL